MMHAAVVSMGVVLVGGVAFAGDLNPPPGPVLPTMKTLDQVEPSTPVNALSGDGNSVHLITQSGAYHLTGNIVSPGAGFFGIEVTTEGVTIDLNGFSIEGFGEETLPAIGAGSGGVVVMNGTIDDWEGDGVRTFGTTAVRDVVFDNVSGAPVNAGQGSVIRGCQFRFCEPIELDGTTLVEGCVFRDMASVIDAADANGVTVRDCVIDGQGTVGTGSVLRLGNDARVEGVNISSEGQTALRAGNNVVVTGCVFAGIGSGSVAGVILGNTALIADTSVSDYGGRGIQTGFGAVVRGCTVINNEGGGIFCSVSAVIRECTVYTNGGDGIGVNNGAQIESNLVRSNTGDGIVVGTDSRVVNNTLVNDLIRCTGSDNAVDSNSVADANPNPIIVTGSGNIVTRNVLTTGSISAGAGNIIAPTRVAANFNIAGPWDNFQP